MMIIIKAFRVPVICFLLCCSMACNTAHNQTKNGTGDSSKNNKVTLYTFPVSKGFGYSIFVNNKEFIRQACIPVVTGNKPFASANDAKKTGVLVVGKLMHNQLPSVTLNELKQLNISL